jgi:hypothetical protein
LAGGADSCSGGPAGFAGGSGGGVAATSTSCSG